MTDFVEFEYTKPRGCGWRETREKKGFSKKCGKGNVVMNRKEATAHGRDVLEYSSPVYDALVEYLFESCSKPCMQKSVIPCTMLQHGTHWR